MVHIERACRISSIAALVFLGAIVLTLLMIVGGYIFMLAQIGGFYTGTMPAADSIQLTSQVLKSLVDVLPKLLIGLTTFVGARVGGAAVDVWLRIRLKQNGLEP